MPSPAILPYRLCDFDNELELISSVWLCAEIGKLRPDGISEQGFSKVRVAAQTRKHVSNLTLRETVRIIFVSLYNPQKTAIIKKLIKGPNLNEIDVLDLDSYVDKWIRLDYPYARDLVLRIISLESDITVGEVQTVAKKHHRPLDIKTIRRILRVPQNKRLSHKTKLTIRQALTIGRNLSV